MKSYKQLVTRIQTIIVGVTQAEKQERETEQVKQKNILGYDPEKWAKAEAKIRDEEHHEL